MLYLRKEPYHPYQHMSTKSTTIFSWNVNGLRALIRKGDFDRMLAYPADAYCLQETKVTEEQLDEVITCPTDFSCIVSASQERKGHAGTTLYSKEAPKEVLIGFPDPWKQLDVQGRIITATFPTHTLINCYFPNGGSNTSSLEYKLEFYAAFLNYINGLRADGQNVIIAGDWNIAHTEHDLARPKENAKSIGFLPEERAWLDRYEAEGWIDAWRYANPDARDNYTWWDLKTGARDRNVGWRIDYIFVDKALLSKITSITHLTDMYGSDHCPVVMEIEI